MTSQVTRYASVLDTILNSAEVDLRFTFGSEHPGADSLEYWARFKTDEDEGRIRELMTLLEKGCHTTNTIRGAVPVIPHLRLNGKEIPYTPIGVPPGPEALQNPSLEKSTTDASVRIIDTYWREGTSEGHRVNADETSRRGGTSEAPSPLLHFMMGTGFGIGSQAVRSAQQIGIQMNHFAIDIETAYDTRGKMMLGDFYTGQIWFKYWLDMQSPESPSRAVEFLNHLERYCPTTHTLRWPVKLIPHVLVNGREISYRLPELSSPEALLQERGFEADEGVFARGFPNREP